MESDDNFEHVQFIGGCLLIGVVNLFLEMHTLVFLFGLSVLIFPIAFDKLNDPGSQFTSRDLTSLRNRISNLATKSMRDITAYGYGADEGGD